MPRSCLKPVVHFEMRFCENINVIDFEHVTDSKIPIVTSLFRFIHFQLAVDQYLYIRSPIKSRRTQDTKYLFVVKYNRVGVLKMFRV